MSDKKVEVDKNEIPRNGNSNFFWLCAPSVAEELATAIFLAKCSKCGPRAGNRNIFWWGAPSLVEKLAETAILLGESASIVASMCTSGTTVPLWMKILFQWHFRV